MNLRERTRASEPEAGEPAPDVSGDSTARRQQAARLIAAGHAAIERALSSDSETFLRQTKQQGGQ